VDDGGAVIALTNPGGIRTDLLHRDNGTVSYGDLFASQPFRNRLVTMTLTGAQIRDLLEQQWLEPKRPRILQISNGFSYAWDASKPLGERVVAARMTLDGRTIDPAAPYRVTVNDYLASGGDGFTVARQGASPQYGGYDTDALFAFFKAHGPVGPLPQTRIIRLN
jgi:5'-nucleotidase